MKFLLLPLLLLLSVGLTAQRTADIKSGFTEFDKKRFEAMQMNLDAAPDRVAESWEEFWEERYEIDIDKEDRDKTSTTYLAEQVSVPVVSDKNFNLYSKVAGAASRTTLSMAAAFTDNDAVTMDRYPTSYNAAKAIMEEFRTYFYTGYFDEQLAEARSALDDVRDDSQDASEDAQKARKKIEKYEDKIAKLQRKIEETREEVGDELETSEEKARRARELEDRVRELERMRARYLG